MLHAGLFAEFFTESHTLFSALAHKFQAALGHANKHHGVLKTAWPETALGDFKPTAFSFNHIADGDADVLKDKLGFTAG